MVRNYDAVVIGAGNGGLVAAARLAKEGKKTLLIERHNLPGGFATSFVRGRFEFEASLHELCGVGSITGKSPLQKIFTEVGAADKIEWVALDEAFRLITLDKQCDCEMPLGKEAFIKKLEEYDPGSEAVVRKIFDLIESIEKTLDFVSNIEDFKPAMIKEIFSEHTEFLKVANYSVDEVLKAFGASQKTRDILNGYWCYLGQPTDELNVIHYFTMLHSYIIDGAVIPRGRSHQLSTALLEAFTENGGDAWFNTSVTKIIVENGTAKGVILDDGMRINAKAVICNASPYNAYTKLIDKDAVPEKLKREVNAKTLGAKGFAVFLGLNRSAEEIGLNNHTYFIYPTNDNRKCYELGKKIETNDVQATVCLNKAFDDCSPEGTSILYMT
ncbi:MAG: NAD(P)/FAD-dependent oxidoreductase, partial [Clostridia bacterium]|nr:NAD(P)/FAD-dependent oxidoreductase [Clostridia bacterium]